MMLNSNVMALATTKPQCMQQCMAAENTVQAMASNHLIGKTADCLLQLHLQLKAAISGSRQRRYSADLRIKVVRKLNPSWTRVAAGGS